MSTRQQRELAQAGLKYIEDAVVALLTRHPEGMPMSEIAESLGLSSDLDAKKRDLIAMGVLELLVKSGRILWDEEAGRYKDNPEVS